MKDVKKKNEYESMLKQLFVVKHKMPLKGLFVAPSRKRLWKFGGNLSHDEYSEIVADLEKRIVSQLTTTALSRESYIMQK